MSRPDSLGVASAPVLSACLARMFGAGSIAWLGNAFGGTFSLLSDISSLGPNESWASPSPPMHGAGVANLSAVSVSTAAASSPVMFAMYGHMVAMIYYAYSTNQHIKTASMAYLFFVLISSIGLGYDCIVTIVVALAINHLSWFIVNHACVKWCAVPLDLDGSDRTSVHDLDKHTGKPKPKSSHPDRPHSQRDAQAKDRQAKAMVSRKTSSDEFFFDVNEVENDDGGHHRPDDIHSEHDPGYLRGDYAHHDTHGQYYGDEPRSPTSVFNGREHAGDYHDNFQTYDDHDPSTYHNSHLPGDEHDHERGGYDETRERFDSDGNERGFGMALATSQDKEKAGKGIGQQLSSVMERFFFGDSAGHACKQKDSERKDKVQDKDKDKESKREASSVVRRLENSPMSQSNRQLRRLEHSPPSSPGRHERLLDSRQSRGRERSGSHGGGMVRNSQSLVIFPSSSQGTGGGGDPRSMPLSSTSTMPQHSGYTANETGGGGSGGYMKSNRSSTGTLASHTLGAGAAGLDHGAQSGTMLSMYQERRPADSSASSGGVSIQMRAPSSSSSPRESGASILRSRSTAGLTQHEGEWR
mmetsp:Transcript_27266/g.63775  ORF Transcript_27266/g.63775 Transcript_27266/m.63775 type:complete len:583 (+) Transcript_27266:2-1750(+)